jgi:TetR/AcrR family transcriptional repressor of nem operon
MITSEVSRMGDEAQKSYERGLESLISGLAELALAMGIADAECVASSVAAELVGGISLARAVADRRKSDRILEHSKRSILSRLGLGSDAALEETPDCLAGGRS